MGEPSIWRTRISGKLAGSGIGLISLRVLVPLLDWWGRFDLLKEHYGGVVKFIDGPYGTLVLVLGGFALIALAVRSGLQKPRGDAPTQQPPPPPDGPPQPPRPDVPLFDVEEGDTHVTDLDTEGGGSLLRQKGGKFKGERWRHRQ
jgi:hypothetical protein